MSAEQPIWTPSLFRIADANLTRFMSIAADRGAPLTDYGALHDWSVSEPAAFWQALWDFSGVIGEQGSGATLENGDRMPGARWFAGARLNFAENLLRGADTEPAIIFRNERGDRLEINWCGLRADVARVAAGLRADGVAPGDVVAGFLPNLPEAVISMLATASIGAIWTSCSPDFGIQGVLDRFGQVKPKVLFTADGYFYAGKTVDSLAPIASAIEQLPSVARVVVVPYVQSKSGTAVHSRSTRFADYGERGAPAAFARLPFDHPLYVLYSSGTTGAPKCIVHGAGGTLLQHLKEHLLHTDLKPGDRLFFFTTCGWMMWNWLASALASRATLVLYDGSPLIAGGRILFDYADAARMTVFGTSAKYIDSVAKAGLRPRLSHRLTAMKALLSTGSPLAPEGFDYVYRDVKRDLHLASISGGTDIVSCFVLGNPTAPVWRGEIQGPGLGMKVEVFDDEGRPVRSQKGELVCTAPFPSMPVGFWNDPDGAKYRAAYFEKYPGVWCHGDYIEQTAHGGYVIYGRSDAVLNPGGVRIGTAEIYRQVEGLEEVVESLVIGQDWPPDRPSDVRIVLFVRLRDGMRLDDALAEKIRRTIRANATPRHVPARIVQVPDIPRTRSGKIVELAVRNVVHGRPVKNLEALANPEALAHYKDRAELTT